MEMFEYHIDAMKELSAFVKLENKDIGGSLSVQMLPCVRSLV